MVGSALGTDEEEKMGDGDGVSFPFVSPSLQPTDLESMVWMVTLDPYYF